MKNLTFYKPKEEKINVISHFIGLLLSIVAFVLLLTYSIKKGHAKHIISTTIYGVSLILLYTASTTYHYVQTPKWRKRLNILDHAAIYILIAGTYTPFTLLVLKGWIGWAIFGISWSLAFLGVTLKIFFTGRFNKISTTAYVLMGWLIVFAIKPLLQNLSLEGLWWLFLGGIFYTVGAVIYSIKKIKYNHAIFHVFVLLGSFSHFISVYFYVLM